MTNMTLTNIAAACGGQYQGPQAAAHTTVEGVVIDSRQVEPGFLYIPIVGERVDGHSFISQVWEQGAAGVLSMRPLDTDRPYILVKDTRQALGDLAAFYRETTGIKVIGITGSVGKTSTKEMIASVLEQKYQVLKTEGNYNNEIGLPLTIFQIRPEHQVAVLEMGIDSFGEMHRLSQIAKPDTVVMTNIGTCHLENLGTRDGILKAKSEIFDFLSPQGAVVLNGDDDKLETITQVQGKKPIYFGIHSSRDIYATQMVNLGFEGTRVRLHHGKESVEVRIPLPGEHMVYNALAALAVGRLYGLEMSQIKAGIEQVQAISGRVHLIHTDNLTIMDDCYNANPSSMMASIDILQSQDCGRRVAVLGDMFELGEEELQLHRQVGTHAAKAGLDLILCTGSLSRAMYDSAREAGGNAQYFSTLEELKSSLPMLLRKGDTVIVKASHGMEFAQVVDELQKMTLLEESK